MTEESKQAEAKTGVEAKESKQEQVDVTKLSDTDIRYREKYKHSVAQLEEAKLKSQQEKEELASKLSEKEKHLQMLENKMVESELERHAKEAGLKDLEFLKLADKTHIKMVDGKIEGIDKTISELKTKKPDWFGEQKKTSTSTGAGFNRDTGTKAAEGVNAWDLDRKDFLAKKAELTRGRYRR